MLNGSIFISSAGYIWPPAARNIRSNFWPVDTKGSVCILYVTQVETSEVAPQLDVAPASAMTVGNCPLITIFLMFCSDRFATVSQLGGGCFVQLGVEGNCGVNTWCVGDGFDNFGCSSTWQGGGTSGVELGVLCNSPLYFIGYCVITSYKLLPWSRLILLQPTHLCCVPGHHS